MSDIKKGDLVMVVRWPHNCPTLGGDKKLGVPFIAGDIWPWSLCNVCSAEFGPGTQTHPDMAGVPLAWLKKIDPPALPEDVEHKEELPA